jgi:predicted glycoside hydrolase/deacetylase ChbG (UPF0249 family)
VELRGAPPTHLDSHKHLHAAPGALEAFRAVAREQDLPVRAIDPAMAAWLRGGGVRTADRFIGDAAMRPDWTLERLAAAIDGLEEGITELMAHPGYRPSHARTSFGVERETELAALCSETVRRAVARAEIRLVDFAGARASLAAVHR